MRYQVRMLHYGQRPITVNESDSADDAMHYAKLSAEVQKGYNKRFGISSDEVFIFFDGDIHKIQIYVLDTKTDKNIPWPEAYKVYTRKQQEMAE